MSELRARFDWYEATFDEFDDGRIAPSLAVVLDAELRNERGRNGYAECVAVVRGENELVRVYGRSARIGEVHLVTTGESCDEVVPIVRRLYSQHRVSRVDSAVDLLADFDSLDSVALDFAKGRGLSHRLITDSDGGATRYLGATSSEVFTRIYKKSEQLKRLHPERASQIPEGVVRIEQQARPGKRETKERASTMTPDEVWGLSAWGRDFALQVLEFDAERVSTHFRRPSSWQRARHYLGLQYGPMVRQRAADVGREAAVAELLEVFGL